jgi:hypothetical protein
MYICGITPRRRKLYSFWIDFEQAAGLKAVKERDGIPESEQIRRAISAWLEGKSATSKTVARKTARRRP